MRNWVRVLKLNERREAVEGSAEAFAAAVGRGADVRGYSTFDYGEHMGVRPDEGLVQEMMSFATVYRLAGGHVAGIQTMRYPANGALDFGGPPSLSFFLNNENGRNGVARLYLIDRAGEAKKVVSSTDKYRPEDTWDASSRCPSENFTYDFGEYGWWVLDTWEEILAHDANGVPTRGSLAALQHAFRAGRDMKVGVEGLCDYLAPAGTRAVGHEVFAALHSVYNHQDSGFLGGESVPIVRVAPAVPLKYRSGNWDCGWILPRTDGIVHQLIINPYTRTFTQTEGRFAVRWFVR